MTLTFWVDRRAMTIVVLGLLLYPLLKKTAVRVPSGKRRLPVYRQQFSELEQDRSSGLLTDEQYRMARQELERRLLEETSATEPASATSGQLVNVKFVALALVMLIPAASGVLYWTLGNPAAMTHPAASPMSAQGRCRRRAPNDRGASIR